MKKIFIYSSLLFFAINTTILPCHCDENLELNTEYSNNQENQ